MMGLIGIIIASIVNMFMQSTMMHYVISILGVLIFVGLTAYDTQKIKKYVHKAKKLKKFETLYLRNGWADFQNSFGIG